MKYIFSSLVELFIKSIIIIIIKYNKYQNNNILNLMIILYYK